MDKFNAKLQEQETRLSRAIQTQTDELRAMLGEVLDNQTRIQLMLEKILDQIAVRESLGLNVTQHVSAGGDFVGNDKKEGGDQ